MIEGPRGCRPQDLADVIGLVDAAMRQGSDQTMRTDYPLVYAAGNLPNVSVVLEDGRAVATAPVLPRRVVGDGFDFGLGVISPTATNPAHQHRGYGSRCVARCVERMADMGLELSVLWTAVATFPFYELNGWQAVERYGRSCRLSRADADRFEPWPGNVRSLGEAPSYLADVLALHDACGDRVTRSAAEATQLFGLPKMTTWLAMERDGRVAAYLLESRATNKPGLLEAGGDPAAIAGLIRRVLEPLPAGASIDLQAGFAPDGLAEAAAANLSGAAAIPYDGNMMLRLNDVPGFLRAIRSWLAARMPHGQPVSFRVTDADVTVSIERRAFGIAIASREMPEHVELTRGELTSVLFGSHVQRPVGVPPALAWMGPFHVPIPILDRS